VTTTTSPPQQTPVRVPLPEPGQPLPHYISRAPFDPRSIEKLTPEQILKREIATGQPTIYRLKENGELDTIIEMGQTKREKPVDASGPEGKGGPLRTADATPEGDIAPKDRPAAE